MGLKRQIRLNSERPKNDSASVGMTASNIERVLAQWVMPDDAIQYGGAGPSASAPGNSPTNRTFFRIAMIEDTAIFNAAGQLQLATPLPAGAVPLSGHVNYDTAITLAGGATGISFGITGTLNQLAQTTSASATAKNTKADNPIVATIDAAQKTLFVTATNDAGAATGTATGTVRVRVIYRYAPSIPNQP